MLTTRSNAIAALACVTLFGAGAATSPATPLEPRLHVKPCVVGQKKTPARCGTFVVFEDAVRDDEAAARILNPAAT